MLSGTGTLLREGIFCFIGWLIKNIGVGEDDMKKNIILLLTAAVLTLSVTGCSSSKFSVIESDSLLESTVTSQVSVQSAVSGSEITAEDGYGEGRIGDVMHTYFFDYTVNSARVAAEYEGYVPAEGNQMLIAEVTVKNTGTQSIEMYDTDFQAQWNDDAEDAYRFPITTDPETFDELPVLNEEQLPGTYPLAVDEEVTGLLVFEVPGGNLDFSLSYQEVFDDESVGDMTFVYFTAKK